MIVSFAMRRFYADSVRRWMGAIFLSIAVAMMVSGDLFLAEDLTAYQYLLFWSTCFLFTGMAIFVAALDALVVFRKATEHQRKLFSQTVSEIEKRTGEPLPIRFRSAE